MTSNETKWDVFVDAVDALADAQASGGNVGHQDANLFMAEYEKALPDDLPVIPKVQSDWIKQWEANDGSLFTALDDETTPIEVAKTFRVLGRYTDKNKDKRLKLQNTFARAWLLGVWRVEETGEIVKLEAEK